MTTYSGPLKKMKTEPGNPVAYSMIVGENTVELNPYIGKNITLRWMNEIICLHCGKPIKKSFGQGYCYPCFISAPENEECVLRPELCRAHEGIARDMVWATEHCLQDHFVYLALTSDIKVGVTRMSQIPTRWIDQGAWKAVKIARTPNRYLAGVIEVELKKYLKDKTNWREMLTNKLAAQISLEEEKNKITTLFPDALQPYILQETEITEITYPVIRYPEKVTSIDIEKTGQITGMLTGIKGQYLMFNFKDVINIRKFGGYVAELIQPA
jgi:hypothetical protein